MYDVSLKRKWDAEAIRQYQEQQLLKAREEGEESGIEKGVVKGIAKGLEQGLIEGTERAKTEIIEHMLSTTELTAKEIAALTNVSVDFVEQVKNGANKSHK